MVFVNSSGDFKLKMQRFLKEQVMTYKWLYSPFNESIFKFFLTFLINCMLILSMFPDCCKKALIVPTPKPGLDRHALSSFSPISFISFLSKIYEYIIVSRLKVFVTSNSIIIPEQVGYRSKHSIQHQLWRVTELVQEGFQQRQKAGVVFMTLLKSSTWSGPMYLFVNWFC